MRYDAKIDAWISLLLWGTNIMLLGLVFTIPKEEIWIYLLTVSPMIILMVWLILGSYYEFREEDLYMKLGPFFGRIKYKDIKSVELKTNWLSSMAMTSKRIEIRVHGKGFFRGTTYIGPKDREEFLYDLINRCPNLESKRKIDDNY